MSELNELLNSFSRIVFLTGAGVSTASGILTIVRKTDFILTDRRRNICSAQPA